MKIISNCEYAIASTDVRNINNKEMRQMHELKTRIKEVLDSHKKESEKKEYINDEELSMMHAILCVFTKEYSSTQTSAFDDMLKELKDEKKPQSRRLPDDDLFGGDEPNEVPI